jgi:glycosyltransferase involved in cell wall biosynthesis
MSQKVILYIGNHLGVNGQYPSVAQVLTCYLPNELRFNLVSNHRNQFFRLTDMIFTLLRYGNKQQPVIIDTYSSLAFYYALICVLVCRIFSWKYICVLRGGNLPNRLKYYPRFSKYLFSGACKLVAPSRYLHDSFSLYGYPCLIIPNPIEIEKYTFKLRSHVNPRLLWVRAFDSTYNPEMAIEVVDGLKKQFPDVELCMVGPDKDGSLQICKTLAKKLGVDKHIIFTGLLSKDAWLKLAADYDIFINTTNFDNTPVSVLEAMALGMPVVSTEVGGIPYLIKSEINGILVSKNSHEEMVEAIIKLCLNPELSSIISINANRDLKKMDIKNVSLQWQTMINDVISF